jgi:hypothetical protein
MKAKELIKLLKSVDADTEVHIAIDSECNAIKTVYAIEWYHDGKYVFPEGKHSKDYHHSEWKKFWVDTGQFLTIIPTDTIVNN